MMDRFDIDFEVSCCGKSISGNCRNVHASSERGACDTARLIIANDVDIKQALGDCWFNWKIVIKRVSRAEYGCDCNLCNRQEWF